MQPLTNTAATPSLLRENALFRGMTEEETAAALTALGAQEKRFHKDTYILRAGDTTDRLGIVLSGSVTIESNDVWGNNTILSHIAAGDLFAETYAMLPGQVLLVDAVANEDCRILFLKTALLKASVLPSSALPASTSTADAVSGGSLPGHALKNGTGWLQKMTANLLQVSLRKNLNLSNRSFQTAPKTIRGRVLAYLNTIALQTGNSEFDIPFDRQQLADYLNVERTALSKELGRMQKDGILRCRRSHFVLLQTD